MIQIRGKVYKPSDYATLKQVLVLGTKALNCQEYDSCSTCPHKTVCNDIDYVLDYCDEKIKEGGAK